MLMKFKKYIVNDDSVKHGHTYIQWAIALATALVYMTVGTMIGWVSPMKMVLRSKECPTGAPLTDAELSAVASALTLAAVVGLPLCSWIADAYGRKPAILLIIALQSLSWMLKLKPIHTAVIIIAQASGGMAYGGCGVVVTTYIREIGQDNIKGILVTIVISIQYIGLFGIYAMGSYVNYYTTQWILLCFTIVTFLLMLLVPESPAFLVKVGKLDVATNTLARLRGLPADDKIITNKICYMIEQAAQDTSAESVSVTLILKNKAWIRAFVLSQIMTACVASNGAFGIMTYARSILRRAGMSVGPDLLSLTVPTLLMLGTIVPIYLVEKVGRKAPLVAAYLTSAVSVGGLASALVAQRCGAAVPGWLLVLCIAVAVSSYSAGIVSLPLVIMTEMFRFQVRAKIMTVVIMIAFVVQSIYVAIFDPIANEVGLCTMFFFSTGVNLLGAVTVLVWVPETRGKTVEQIEAMLVRNKSEPCKMPDSGTEPMCNS